LTGVERGDIFWGAGRYIAPREESLMNEYGMQSAKGEAARMSTGRLMRTWMKGDFRKNSPEKMEMIRRELIARGELLLPEDPALGLTVCGVFKKRRVRPIRRYGLYRGKGVLHIGPEGIAVSGKHVYSVAARWGIALLAFVGILVLTGGMFAPGFIPLYLGVEYGILKKQNIFVPFAGLRGYAVNPRKRLVSIEFWGQEGCSPVVMYCHAWPDVARALRWYAPQCDATPWVPA